MAVYVESGRCGWGGVRGVLVRLLMVVISLMLSGCVIGPILGVFMGPRSETEDVEPEYVLSKGKLAILIDSRSEVASLSGVRPLLSWELARELRSYNLTGEIVREDEIGALRANTQNFNQLSIAEVGKGLAVGQVLYVEVLEFSLGTVVDKPSGRGMMRARVKVFDVEQDRRVWPEKELLGREVVMQTPFRQAEESGYRQVFAEDICKRTSIEIVKYFRTHKALRKPPAD